MDGSRLVSMASCALALMCSSSQAQAAVSPAAAISEAISQDASDQGMRALYARGVRQADVLLIEALPKGGHLAEVAFDYKGKRLRLPLKLERTQPKPDCASWRLSWAPHPDYINALLNMSQSEALVRLDGAPKTQWSAQARMPALPLIVTRARTISPYGKIELGGEAADKISANANELAPPQALLLHTRRWLDETLEGESGVGAIDLIADGGASWLDFQRVLLGVASLGLFKVYVVTRQEEGLGVLEANAPVFGSLSGPKAPAPLVIGYYPSANQQGFRVSMGTYILKDEDTCDAQLSFCPANEQALLTRLGALAKKLSERDPALLTRVMFAAPADAPLGASLRQAALTSQGLGLRPGRLFVGYIRR